LAVNFTTKGLQPILPLDEKLIDPHWAEALKATANKINADTIAVRSINLLKDLKPY